jgi:hypothetical protein
MDLSGGFSRESHRTPGRARVDLGQIAAGRRGGTTPQGRGLLIEINRSRSGQAYDFPVLREENAP